LEKKGEEMGRSRQTHGKKKKKKKKKKNKKKEKRRRRCPSLKQVVKS